MKIDEKQLIKTAQLARLKLTHEEELEFSRQISDIINYIEKINEIKTDGINPSDHIVDLSNVFREDKTETSLERKDIESIAPRFEDGHFIVPKIIEGAE